MKYFKIKFFKKGIFYKSWSPSPIFFKEKNSKNSTNFQHWKMTLKIRILRYLRKLLIILLSLMVTLFSEKCLFPLDAYVVSCPTGSKNIERTLTYMLDCMELSSELQLGEKNYGTTLCIPISLHNMMELTVENVNLKTHAIYLIWGP